MNDDSVPINAPIGVRAADKMYDDDIFGSPSKNVMIIKQQNDLDVYQSDEEDDPDSDDAAELPAFL